MNCETCKRPGRVLTHLPGSVQDVVTGELNTEPLEVWTCPYCPGGAMVEYLWVTVGTHAAPEEEKKS